MVILLILLFLPNASATSFFGDQNRGWHWYETLPEPESPQETPPETPQTASAQVKAYREELENRLHTAWLDPTPQNLKAYQEMQKDMMDRSKMFSTSWMQNVFQNPNLDHTLVSPVNQQGRHLQIDLEKSRKEKVIQNLSQEYGLFFFFSSDCPYCHQFAPIVKRFAAIYGWDVIAVSGDGGGVAEFPNPESDNGLIQAWGIQTFPSLYAVNPNTQSAIPIAHGLTSLDEMETRIMTLAGDPQ
jgi:conjugal transfer pilus assembly protein TraF